MARFGDMGTTAWRLSHYLQRPAVASFEPALVQSSCFWLAVIGRVKERVRPCNIQRLLKRVSSPGHVNANRVVANVRIGRLDFLPCKVPLEIVSPTVMEGGSPDGFARNMEVMRWIARRRKPHENQREGARSAPSAGRPPRSARHPAV